MKTKSLLSIATIAFVAACATSDIQPLSQDSFKVATTAAPACGPTGTRNVAFKTASVEVIRRGADKFVIVGDTSDSNFWSGSHAQSMTVRVIPEGSPEAANALSARGQLGSDWQEIVSKGAPLTCT